MLKADWLNKIDRHKRLTNIVLLFFALAIPFGLMRFVWDTQQSELISLDGKISSLESELDQTSQLKQKLNNRLLALRNEIDSLPTGNTVKTRIAEDYDALQKEIQAIQTLSSDVDLKDILTFKKDIVSLRKDMLNSRNSLITSMIQALGGAFFFITAYLTFRNVKATEDKQISERFSKALETLKDPSSELVKAGGVYSLEQIATDSPKVHWVIMEVLSIFVKESLPIHQHQTNLNSTKVRCDVQAALTVLGRRDFRKDPKDKFLDLSYVSLCKADLREAHFNGINLEQTDLREANLRQANLKGARIWQADLSEADLTGIVLNGASLLKKTKLIKTTLDGGELEEANLTDCSLEGASLKRCNLRNASLKNADLKDAHLEDALGLIPEQIVIANNWQLSHYSSSFRDKLQSYCQNNNLPYEELLACSNKEVKNP